MATNRIHHAGDFLALDVSDATHPGTDVDSGDPLLINHLPAVALTDEDDDDIATVQIGSGVFELSVDGAVTEVGQPVYITSAGALNRTDTNNLFGFALETKASAAAVIPVKLAAQSDNVPTT